MLSPAPLMLPSSYHALPTGTSALMAADSYQDGFIRFPVAPYRLEMLLSQGGKLMIGCIILSTPRSGTNWLAELINSTRRMGNCTEWLHPKRLGRDLKNTTIEKLTSDLLECSATDNGRFSLKIFPFQLYKAYRMVGADLIRHLRQDHSVSLVVLRRRDRLRQAVSLTRSNMTGAWSSAAETELQPRYDFDRICSAYFTLERNNSFWPGYLDLQGFDYRTYFYEDMLESPQPCIDWIAAQLGVEPPSDMEKGKLSIQRDNITEEWAERFREDLSKNDVLGHAEGRSTASRSPSNVLRLLTKTPLKPYQI